MKKNLLFTLLIFLAVVALIGGINIYRDYFRQTSVADEQTVDFHGEIAQSEKMPVIFYSERNVINETQRLWKKKGNAAPEPIITPYDYMPYYYFLFIDFREMNGKTYALFNIGKKIIAVGTDEQTIKDVYASDSNIDQAVLSKDKNRLLIFRNQIAEGNKQVEDSLSEFDIVSGKSTVLWKGPYAPFDVTRIDAWLERDKKLLFPGENGGMLIFDMRSGEYHQIEEKEVVRLKGGKIYFSSKFNIPYACLMGEDTQPSVYEVIYLANETSLGKIGEKGKRIGIVRAAPDQLNFLFSVIPQRKSGFECDDNDGTKYYLLSINPSLSTTVNEVRDFRSILGEWYPNESYQEFEGGRTKIFSSKGELLFTLPGDFTFLAFYQE